MRTDRTRSVASSPDGVLTQSLPAASETLSGTVRRLHAAQSRPPDRQRSGQPPSLRSPPSGAMPQPTSRTHSADTHSPKAVRLPLPAAYLPSSLTTYRPPIHQPSATYVSAEECACWPLDARRISSSTRGSNDREPTNVRIEYPVHSLPLDAHIQRVQ